jgi:hypothetical protein
MRASIKGRSKAGFGEADARAAAEDHELGLELGQRLEVRLGQRLEAVDRPGRDRALRGHDNAAAMLDAVDDHAIGAVAGDGVRSFDAICLEFHRVSTEGVWLNYRFCAAAQSAPEISLKPIAKSSKLANVCYDIRGPVLDKARQMQEEGHKIIQLNIGNIAAFGLEPPDEIVQDMIRNLPHTAGYTDSKGLFAPRRAVVHYTQEKQVKGVTVDDVYLGNGASELIVMSLNAMLDDGDEVLLPSP